MRFRKFGSTYVVRIDKGEEILSTLQELCEEQGILLGTIEGIGATHKATIGLFETASKEYHSTELTGDHEITSLNGTVTTKEGKVYLHLHATLSDRAYKTYGGHLNAAVVSGACEIVIRSIEGTVERVFDEDVGLNLLDI